MPAERNTIAIIGLGYVGLPLAIAFAENYDVLGFDVNENRIEELSNGIDSTLEAAEEEIINSHIKFTSNIESIAKASIYIITVPTPVRDDKTPDLRHLVSATESVSSVLSKGNYVIYESTVYPGTTEEVCIPILENSTDMKCNIDFYVGYSPERINPGDQSKSIKEIIKVTSGSNEESSVFIDNLYSKIIEAGTHRASSIKVAEAAKVIENTQRDINIALANELSIIFSHLDIDTHEVLDAAATKWNFHRFVPGMVGGHCIGVDPYYLTYKSEQVGYKPEMILAGRKLNDGMAHYYAKTICQKMEQENYHLSSSKILIMGMTFKENCPDYRNTKVVDLINDLISKGIAVDVFDPFLVKEHIKKEFKLNLIEDLPENFYDAIVIAVSHSQFKTMGIEKIRRFGKSGSFIFDIKNTFPIKNDLIRI